MGDIITNSYNDSINIPVIETAVRETSGQWITNAAGPGGLFYRCILFIQGRMRSPKNAPLSDMIFMPARVKKKAWFT